jgi:hypothetical protein
MTLAQAQKEFDDAIEMKTEHGKDVMTEAKINSFAANIFGKDKPAKVLFSQIGKYSSRIIVSHMAYLEDQRQLSMIPGTKVIMTGAEGDIPKYKDKVWDVTHGPQWMCGDNVVWLEGFSGSYCCQYLKIVE